MSKRYTLEEGQIYAIPLSDSSYTVGQLVNHHQINSKVSEDTFAFFNYKLSIKDLTDTLDSLDLSNPFAIVTSNSSPFSYEWRLIGSKSIAIKFEYKNHIGTLGLYKNRSTDPEVFLEPFFGLFPWDGYFKSDYLNKHILPNIKMRNDVKYLKDFTTEELKKLLPSDSPKLIQRLEEDNK